jgi:tetratricopeptide (TPR) repeat protein
MSAELLESTFVQRETLARRLTEVFSESASGESRHHVLLVGPRGVGKSHIVSVVYHRLKRQEQLRDKLVVAYLREDEWGVTSLLDLLIRILKAMELGEEEASLEAELTALSKLSSSQAEEEAWRLLEGKTAGKTLLVIAENLDRVFSSMRLQEQQKLRALLQTRASWALLATATSLTQELSRQTSPFYGFFEIQRLGGLSVSDAASLLTRLAEALGDHETAEFLSTAAGRARVRTVQHLAGGNHRIFVIFFDFLSKGDPEGIVEPLLKTIDSLTPYYQSQMERLSPQQRKIVEFLCEAHSPATVKTIAARCFVSHQTAASQLKQLLAEGFVAVTRVGRESYYELAEPMLRICVEVKCHTAEPIRLLVEFLRYWFSREELEQKLTSMPDMIEARGYISAALEEYDTGDAHVHLTPEIEALCASLTHADCQEQREQVQSVAAELVEVSKIAEDWLHYFRGRSFQGRLKQEIPRIERLLDESPDGALLLRVLGDAHAQSGHLEEALRIYKRALRINPRSSSLLTATGAALAELDCKDEALAAFTEAANRDPQFTGYELNVVQALLALARLKEAEDKLLPLLRHSETFPAILELHAELLARQEKYPDALIAFEAAIKRIPGKAQLWTNKGRVLMELNRVDDALFSLEKARSLKPDDPYVMTWYCAVLFRAGQYQRALETCSREDVAHQLFHQLLEIFNKDRKKEVLSGALLKWQRSFVGEEGRAVIVGSLVEFASFAYQEAEDSDLPLLRRWSEILKRLFDEEPKFSTVLRIFDVVVRYRQSRDERVLLELPLEERSLLQQKDDKPKTGVRSRDNGTNAGT